MSNRNAIIWLSIAIAAAALGHVLLSYNGGVGAQLVQRAHLLSAEPGSVQRIVVSRPGRSDLALARFDGWRQVEPYRSTVDERVVMKLLDALALFGIEESASDQELLRLGMGRGDFGLEQPSIRLLISSPGTIEEIFFGSSTPTGEGVYAAVGGENAVYVVASNVFAAVDLPVDGFRRREIFDVGEELVQTVDLKRGAGSFLRLAREGENWLIVQPKAASASPTRVRRLLRSIVSATAIDFIWPTGSGNEGSSMSSALLAGYGLDPESAVAVTLKCADGIDRQAAFGKEAKDGLVYALVENGGAVVTVDGKVKDLAMEDISCFTDTRLFPVGMDSVARVSVTDRSANYLLAKDAAGGWRLDAPVVAETEAKSVAALLKRIGELTAADIVEGGVQISISTNSQPVSVSRESLLRGMRLENLRSRQIIDIDPVGVRRIVVWQAPSSPTAVVYDKDRRAWNVESSPVPGKADAAAVETLLAALHPLRADWIVKLKVSAADLRAYGLETPQLSIAVDPAGDGAVRRNILVGDEAQGGRFATIGATDAVFVIPTETLRRLQTPLVAE